MLLEAIAQLQQLASNGDDTQWLQELQQLSTNFQFEKVIELIDDYCAQELTH